MRFWPWRRDKPKRPSKNALSRWLMNPGYDPEIQRAIDNCMAAMPEALQRERDLLLQPRSYTECQGWTRKLPRYALRQLQEAYLTHKKAHALRRRQP